MPRDCLVKSRTLSRKSRNDNEWRKQSPRAWFIAGSSAASTSTILADSGSVCVHNFGTNVSFMHFALKSVHSCANSSFHVFWGGAAFGIAASNQYWYEIQFGKVAAQVNFE
jgi:hypothetical protein